MSAVKKILRKIRAIDRKEKITAILNSYPSASVRDLPRNTPARLVTATTSFQNGWFTEYICNE